MPNEQKPCKKRRRQTAWTVCPGDTLKVGGMTIQVARRSEIKLMGVDPSKVVLTKRGPKLRLDVPMEVGE